MLYRRVTRNSFFRRTIVYLMVPAVLAVGVPAAASVLPVPHPSKPNGEVVGSVALPDGSAAVGSIVVVTPLDDRTDDHGHPPIIGASRVDRSGLFAIHLLASEDLVDSARRSGGILNFLVTAIHPSDSQSYLLQHAAFLGVGESGSSLADPIALEYRAENVVPPLSQAAADYCVPGVPSPSLRAEQTVVGRETRLTLVGEYHSWDDMTGSLTYGETADTEIEVKASVGDGPFQAGGAVKIAETKGYAISLEGSNRDSYEVGTNFNYVKERTSLICEDQNGQQYATSSFVIRAEAWDWPNSGRGGNVVGFDGPSSHRDAAAKGFSSDPLPANSTFTRESGKGHFYALAATVFGVEVGASSGYSTNVVSEISSGSAMKNYYVFGSDGPPHVATRLYASSDDNAPVMNGDAAPRQCGVLSCHMVVQTSAAIKRGPAGTQLGARGYCQPRPGSQYGCLESGGGERGLYMDRTPSTQNKTFFSTQSQCTTDDERIGSVTFDADGWITSGEGTVPDRAIKGPYIVCAGYDAAAMWDNFTVE